MIVEIDGKQVLFDADITKGEFIFELSKIRAKLDTFIKDIEKNKKTLNVYDEVVNIQKMIADVKEYFKRPENVELSQ